MKGLLEMIKGGRVSSEEGFRLYKQLTGDNATGGETTPSPADAERCAPSGVEENESAVIYCRSEWAASEPKGAVPGRFPAGAVLIFDTDERLRDAVQEQVVGGATVVLVKPGESFRRQADFVYLINPALKQDYQRLFEALKAGEFRPDLIVHFWSRVEAGKEEEAFLEQLRRGIYSLVYTGQALLEQKPSGRTKLLYLYPSGHTALQPLRAAVGGFARTLRLENPHLLFKAVEVCPADDAQAVVDTSRWLEVVRQEASERADEEVEVSYREGRRFTRRLKEINPEECDGGEATFIRQGGVYLITGGLGSLGLLTAEHLAATPDVRLVLTGRSRITSEKEAYLRGLRARGIEAVYWQADVSRPGEVRELVAGIKSRFKAVHGVVHCAGVVRDAFLLKKSGASFKEVLAPKVFGTVHLDRALKDERLDFFVLYSSLVALTGNAGQSDYAYANHFQDHFADYRERLCAEGRRSGRTLSINWPPWHDGGMGLTEETERWARKSLGLVPLSHEAGLRALDDGLRGAQAQLVVLSGDAEKLRVAYRLDISTPEGATVVASHPALPAAGPERERLRETAEAYLKTALAREVKLPASKIISSEPLEKYGIDSMMIMNVTRDMEEFFGGLPKTLFFEYQNIAELSEYFVNNHADKLVELSGPRATGQADGETKRDVDAPVTPLVGQTLFPTNGKLPANGNGHVSAIGNSRLIVNGKGHANGNGHASVSDDARAKANGNGHAKLNGGGRPGGDGDSHLKVNGGGRETVEEPDAAVGERDADIAVIGLAGRYPMAADTGEFWENLKAGRDCITEIPRERWDYRAFFDADRDRAGKSYSKWGAFLEDVDKFDPLFFNISPREAELMDPQERLFLETVWQTFEDAGYTRARLAKEKAGVFVGVMYAQYQLFGAEESLKGNHVAPGNFFASIANRVSYHFNLRGPSIALDTLCSSSLTAIHLACESIRRGEIEVAVAGGVNVTIHPSKYLNLSQGRFASSDGRCRSFGEGGDGYVPGEGVGALLLKPLSRAVADGDYIYGVIRATAVNHGGKTNGVTVPSLNAQSEVIAEAMRKARVEPRQVSYLEAHGTGTALGDPIEIAGLTKAFRGEGFERQSGDTQFCAVGSVKSNIGHLESAAGVAGVTKVLLQFKHRQLVPSLHSETLNPNIDFDGSPFYVQRELTEWVAPRPPGTREDSDARRLAGVSSFGAGGANAHILLEEFPRPAARAQVPPASQLFLLSARDGERLKAYASKLLKFLSRAGAEDENGLLADLAFTLQVGRESLAERLALVAASLDELKEKLSRYCRGEADIEGLCGGNAVADQSGALLIEGVAGAALCSVLMESRDLSKLGQLWVTGAEIDWRPLHEGIQPRRIPLPTYPFARERYWIQTTGESHTLGGGEGRARLHPLLDANTSTLEEQKFTTRLRGDEFYLSDHVVAGRKLLPGVAVLEMARAAGTLAGRGQVQAIKGTVWASPVALELDGGSKEINVGLYPADGDVEYEVWSRRADGSREVHAQGKVVYGEARAETERLDVESALARCKSSLSGEECYGLFLKHGLAYGPRFRPVRALFCGAGEAVARLQLPDSLRADFDSFSYHPVLLDGALQALLGLLNGPAADASTLYVPFSLGEVELIKPLKESAYAHVTRAADAGQGGVEKFNVRLFDEEGELLVRLDDFSVRTFAQPAARDGGDAQAGETEGILYRPVWEEKVLPASEELAQTAEAGDVLIFDTRGEVREALREQLRLEGTGARAVLVTTGDGYLELNEDSFVVAPDSAGDYRLLLDALQRRNLRPDRIIHLWSYREEGEQAASLSRQLEIGFHSVLRLTQALMEQKPEQRIRLLYVYAGDATTAHPAFAAVSALAKSIRLENPKLSYRTLALPPQTAEDDERAASVAGLLLAEFRTPAGTDEEVRYAGGRRQVRAWAEYAPAHADNSQGARPALKRGGVYLITGGAGGLGLIFAEHLAREAEARLVLTGRSELSAEKVGRLRALQESGAEVVYLRADVSRREEVERLVAEIKTRFGRIGGVLHAAGVTRDSFVLNKTDEEVAAVLAPKLHGTVWLDELTAGEQLDFFVLFSSAAGALGNVGQSDYAFGNCFADHFAARREELRARGERSGTTLSINWPLWQDGGLHTTEDVRAEMRRTKGLVPLKTADGLRAFKAALQSPHAQLMVLAGERQKIEAALRPPSSEAPSGRWRASVEKGGGSRESDAPLLEQVEAHLKRILSAEIKLAAEKISSREPLEQYGLDSVMVMSLTRRLEEHFGELSKTLFFEYRNVGELARYFVEHHRAAVAEKFGAATEAAKAQGPPTKGDSEPAERRPRFQNAARRSAGSATTTGREEIAVVGLAGRYPMADDLAQFWENLKAGKDCITEVPAGRWDSEQLIESGKKRAGKSPGRWGGFVNDADKFDSLFFNISPKEAKIIDPQERLFLETVWHTVEDAGYTRASLEGIKTGVFVGVMYAHYQLFSVEAAHRGTGFTPSSLHASIANRVSYVFNFRGPSIALDTMCSSSLTAIHLACESIRRGECELAVAGGVNLSLHPNKYLALSEGQFTSSDGRCRSFGEGGDGYVPGEGVGALLLKPLSRALADGDHVYAVIKGSAVNHGGKTNGYTVPDPAAQGEVIAAAFREARLDPRRVSYLEAHGTGTSLGDPIEIAGLTKAFAAGSGEGRGQVCHIGSVKSNIGHLESAAGVAGVTKVLLQLKHRQLVPSLHSEPPNPHINFAETPFYVQRTLEEWRQPPSVERGEERPHPRQAGVSSFGAGGSNAHLLLEEYRRPDHADEPSEAGPQLITLSARDEERLKAYAGKIADFLAEAARHPVPSDAPAGEARADIFEQVESDLLSLAARSLGLDPREIDPEEEMSGYGVDAVCLAGLAEQVCRKYNVEAGTALLGGLQSFRVFARHVAEQHAAPPDRHPSSTRGRAVASPAHGFGLADFAYTLQVGREALEERIALVASSLEEVGEKLARYARGEADIEGLYRGNVRSGKSNSEFLLEGREGTEFVETVVAQRKWHKLAKLWLLGVEIDWRLLHRRADASSARRLRLSLPTYPFARVRHWLPEAAAAQPARGARLHPLLDRADLRGSFRQGRHLVFHKTLRAADPLLRDHKVLGRPILPGVGYIGMAYAALSQVEDAGSYNTARVVLLQPLAVTGELDARVVVGEENGVLRFEIQSGDEAAGSGPVTHAKGEFRRREAPAQSSEGRVSVEEIRARCKDELRGEDLYARFREIGIEYGGYYQTVEHVWGGDGEALGLLSLPREYQHELGEHALHPTVLDGALQAIAGLTLNRRERPGLVLPFALEEVEVVRPLTARAYAHVKLVGKDRYHISVLDEHGQTCVRIRELALREVKAKDSPPDFFYVPGWKFAPLAADDQDVSGTSDEGARAKPNGTTLLIHPPRLTGLEEPLVEAAAGEVVQVSLGTHTRRVGEGRWEVNTTDADGLDRWLGQFDDIGAVYFLGGIQTSETDPADSSALEQSQEQGVLSLFRLIKSLIRLGRSLRPLRLKVVTNEAHQVLPGKVVRPYAASLFGLVKSLAKEHTRWAVSCIDVSLDDCIDVSFDGAATAARASGPPTSFSELARWIISEPTHPRGDEVALRGGRRYMRTLTPVDLPPVEHVPLRERGVYLILGGAGGIGLALSRHLAESARARLVLVGRGELSAAQREKIKAVEEAGGEVMYLRADASDHASLRAAVAQAKERFGRIDGAVHSALVLRDRSLGAMSEEEFVEALRPKVAGAAALAAALEGEPLDFLLFFSSAQSFSGNAGQSNYAAACTFKDSFAQYLRARVAYPVKVINWGYWGEVGAVATAEHRKRLEAQGVHPISISEGVEAVRRVLAHPVEQVVPVKADRHLLEAIGIDFQSRFTLYAAKHPSVFASAVQEIETPADDAQLASRVRQAHEEVASLGRDLLLSSFQTMGVFKGAGETYGKEGLRARLRITPAHTRLFDAMLDILTGAGLLRNEGASVTSTRELEDAELKNRLSGLAGRKVRLAEDYPEVAPHVNLLWACSRQTPAILRGEVPATDVIFPDSSMSLVEGIYRGNAVADRCNHYVARAAEAYVRSRLPHLGAGEKIRILEVGAGTGGTTGGVLRALQPHAGHLHYSYTDLSAGFTQHGRKQFGAAHPFVEFKALNIEEDVRAQGFAAGGFDIVVGANVLHATRDLRNALRNVKALLKTNGWLVLNEVTEVQDFTTLTFGLLEGWWLYDDGEIRLKGAPLLSHALWERLLKEEGFKAVHVQGDAREDGGGPGQHVIIAESDGRVTLSQVTARVSERPAGAATRQTKEADTRAGAITATLASTVTTSRERAAQVEDELHPATVQPYGAEPTRPRDADYVTDPEALLDDTERLIAGCVADALTMPVEEIDRERQFSEYGVDSIIGVDLINVINSALGITLRTTALFDYGNVKELARFVCDTHGPQLREARAIAHASPFDSATGGSDEPTADGPGDLNLLEKLASGELGAEQVYRMLEGNYGQF